MTLIMQYLFSCMITLYGELYYLRVFISYISINKNPKYFRVQAF